MDIKRVDEITQLAHSLGLDPFPVVYETLESITMYNVGAYGLPSRARHWSYGRSYDHQKMYGQMGFSKIYEMIVNNNPSYAFMLDTNSDVENLLIIAHCLGHSDFFKNNVMFQDTNRNMVRHAADHAGRVEEYIEQYGLSAVERIMDIGFALDGHIDWHKGQFRKPYKRHRVKTTKQRKRGEFDDLLAPNRKFEPAKKYVDRKFPPHPEKDLIWFLANYAPLEEWEKDILDIMREEAYYFHPQMLTKIMNEGWASFWHAELMFKYDITPEEHLGFAQTHEKVVQPGGNPFRINPYYLGFKMFKDIEKRWDKLHAEGKSDITGREKIFQVRAEENDISFLRNYLSADLVEELKLFTYGYMQDYPEDWDDEIFIEAKEDMKDEVVEALVSPLYNGGVPKILITGVGAEGTLLLQHESEERGTLDFKFAEKVLEYIWDLWAAPIELSANDDEGEEILLCFDEVGFFIKSLNEEEDEEEEVNGDSMTFTFSLAP